VVSIVAGVLNTCGYNSDGIAATTAQLNGPYSVAVDASGNLFIADNGNNRIREVNASA
jgi:trimeric autotransporter adhesin